MPDVHRYIGIAVVSAFALLWMWGLGAKIVRRDPGEWFWRLVAFVQVAVGIQVIAGIVLLILGYWPPTLLHFVYGFGPAVVLLIAHLMAREAERKPWVVFAWAGFFCFGLTLRALMTGLGTR